MLRYRLAHQDWQAGSNAPLQDAQRSVQVIRSRAAVDEIDPLWVLVMGFSSGARGAGTLQSAFDARLHEQVDEADARSARPDATALIYLVATMHPPFAHPGSRLNLLGKAPSPDEEAAWSNEQRVRPGQPPVFLMHAEDDEAVPVEDALMVYKALREAGVPVFMHLFETGGHGFGLRSIAGTPLEA